MVCLYICWSTRLFSKYSNKKIALTEISQCVCGNYADKSKLARVMGCVVSANASQPFPISHAAHTPSWAISAFITIHSHTHACTHTLQHSFQVHLQLPPNHTCVLYPNSRSVPPKRKFFCSSDAWYIIKINICRMAHGAAVHIPENEVIFIMQTVQERGVKREFPFWLCPSAKA